MAETDGRKPHVNVRLNKPTHERVAEYNRASETLSATIDRALDALEREQDAETWTLILGTDFEATDEPPEELSEVLRNDE